MLPPSVFRDVVSSAKPTQTKQKKRKRKKREHRTGQNLDLCNSSDVKKQPAAITALLL